MLLRQSFVHSLYRQERHVTAATSSTYRNYDAIYVVDRRKTRQKYYVVDTVSPSGETKQKNVPLNIDYCQVNPLNGTGVSSLYFAIQV